jgi:hypothetical protein
MGKTAAFSCGLLAAVFIMAFLEPQVVFKHYEQGISKGFESGYKQGKHDALLPIATNIELEQVCVNMWVSEQLRKDRANAKR